MSFVQLFQFSNLSLNRLTGSMIVGSIEQVRANQVVVETGFKERLVCLQSELNSTQQINIGANCIVGIEHIEWFGELKVLLPRTLHKINRHKFIWTELTQIWRSSHNRVQGFILNSVNGGYAVAIGGHIAFLPKSLVIHKSLFSNQWRFFAILNMTPQFNNIVVKEIGSFRIQPQQKPQSRINSKIGMKISEHAPFQRTNSIQSQQRKARPKRVS